MSDTKHVVVTREGLQRMKEELEYKETTEKMKVAEQLKVAISYGDLSENAEYDEAKNEQARIEGRIRDLEEMLRNAEVVDQAGQPAGVVGVGSEVRVFDLEYEEEDTYTLVGATEADPSKLKVSTESPIGKALIGARVGEVVEAQTPGGVIKLRIDEIH